MKHRNLWISLLSLVMIIASCDDATRTTAPDPSAMVPLGGALLSVRQGIVARQTMEQAIDRITRELAIAMNNPGLREAVHRKMRESEFPEGKLHLRTFLESDGKNLLAGLAAARGHGATRSQVFHTLDSLIDLEFYMPVKKHRDAWDGGRDLIVASALEDDGRPPVAYDLEGRRVSLISSEDPPETPTLAIVPVETDFSRPRVSSVTSDASSSMVVPAILMTGATVYDDHEGFLHGSPEFEVHSYRAKKNDPENFSHLQCSGESQFSPYLYNHDNVMWSGPEVRLLTAASIADSATVRFIMFEDDTERCTQFALKPPKVSGADYSKLATFVGPAIIVGKDIAYPKTNTGTWDLIGLTATTGFAVYSTNTGVQLDDYVGHIEVDACFSFATGPVSRTIREQHSGVIKGYAQIDWRDTGPREMCPPAVVVNGPGQLDMDQMGAWTVSIGSGGGVPFAYQWYKDGVLQSGQTGTSFSSSFGADGDHYVKVRVTPTGFPIATVSHYVFVSAAGCPPGEFFCTLD